MPDTALLTIRFVICALGLFCFAHFTFYMLRQRERTRFDNLFLLASFLNIATYLGLGIWTTSELFVGPLQDPWLQIAAMLAFCGWFILPLVLDYMISFWRGLNPSLCPLLNSSRSLSWLLYIPALVIYFIVISRGNGLIRPKSPETAALSMTLVYFFFIYMIPTAVVQVLITVRLMRRGMQHRERAFFIWLGVLLVAEIINWLVCYVIGAADFADPYSPLHLGTMILPIPFFLIIAYYNYRFIFLDRILKRLTAALILAVMASVYQFAVIPAITEQITARRPNNVSVALILTLTAFIVLFISIKNWLYRFIDRVILKRTDYRNAFIEFSHIVTRETSRDSLIECTLEMLKKVLGVEQARFKPCESNVNPLPSISVVRPHQWERYYNANEGIGARFVVSVPVSTHGRAFGVLEMGSRRDDAPFLTDEISLLEALGNELGAAIEHINLHEQQKEQQLQAQRLRELAAQAELRALQAQINPHFLFNSLNVVAGLIQSDPELAEKMVENLAEVFRYALEGARREFVTLADEIEFVRTYLEIERQRFEEKLEIEVDMDMGLAEIRVPAMILQPLVENAIKHGIAPKVGPGKVTITAERRNGSVHIEVCDNGVGMQKYNQLQLGDGQGMKLAELNLQRTTREGMGLRNVDQRLRSVYGDSAAVHISCLPQSGVRVSFDIPIADGGSEISDLRSQTSDINERVP